MPTDGDRLGTAIHRIEPDVGVEVRTEVLREAIEPVTAWLDECRIYLGPNGLYTIGVDPANVGIVEVDVPAELFKSIEGEREAFGIYLSRLAGFLERAHETVSMAFFADQKSLVVESGPYKHDIATIEPGSIRDYPDPPDLDYSAEVEMQAKQFQDGVEFVDHCSDKVTIDHDAIASELTFSGEGDTDTCVYTLDADGLTESSGDDTEAIYSLDYTQDIADVLPEARTITLTLGTELPFELQYDFLRFGSEDSEAGTVRFIQAPRIQS